MSDNLYQTSTPSGQVVNTVVANTDPLAFFTIDLAYWLYWINIFTFAWCIFYSLILIGNFWYYWVKFGDGEVANEKKGAKAISDAAWMWWSYLTAVLLYLAFHNTPAEFSTIVGWFALVFYICKIIVFDLPDIPFLGPIMGKPGDLITKAVEDSLSGFSTGIGEAISNIFGRTPPPAPPAKK